MGACPDISRWEELATGTLDGAAARELEAHLTACGDCRAVREEMRGNDRMLGALRGALRDAPGAASLIGRRLGRYTIVRVLGSGGTATVYEATQEHPHRTVALKVIHPGLMAVPGSAGAALRRFEQEGEVLARLQHPGIAQVYEAGTADAGPDGGAVPLLAMELVRGRPITEYAEGARLDTRARLGLLADVADAVQHAHTKGVIHRDLKPSNVLVGDDGRARVLDFGIARIVDPQQRAVTMRTDIGQLVGTIAYMSPEQASGDPGAIDTRTDVHALGLMLYELLTGRLPWDVRGKPVHEAVRVIVEQEAAPPSKIDPPTHHGLRGDVDAIAGRALEKNPDRRYESAAALAADIRRHLEGLPVLARPHSTMYQLGKLVRRHRVAVGAGGAVVVALVAGVIGTGYGLVRATRERDNARRSEQTAEKRRAAAEEVTRLLQGMIGSASPHQTRGADYTVRRLLDDFTASLGDDLKDQPEALASIRATVGNAYRLLGEYGKADENLGAALELRKGVAGRARESTEVDAARTAVAQSLDDYAWLLHDRADYAGAAKYFREAMSARESIYGQEHALVAASLFGLADALRHAGEIKEAEPLARRALEMRRKLLPAGDPDIAESLSNLGKLVQERGDYRGAEPYVREAIDIWRAAYPAGHPSLADALNELGWMRHLMGNESGAEESLNEALAMGQRLLGESHPDVATTLYMLANVHEARREFDQAAELLERALAVYRRAHGEKHPAVATTLDVMGTLERLRGNFEAGEARTREALEMRRALYGEKHGEVAISLNNLALVLKAQKKYDEAEPPLREAIEIQRAVYGPETPYVAQATGNLGSLLVAKGDDAGAEPLLVGAADLSARTLGEGHRQTQGVLLGLGRLYVRGERWEEAEARLGRCVASGEGVLAARDYGEALTERGRCLVKLGREAEAEAALEKALEWCRGKLSPKHAWTAAGAKALAELYDKTGRAERAAQVRAQAEEDAKAEDAKPPPGGGG